MENIKKYEFFPLGDENIDYLIPLYKKIFNQNFDKSSIRAKYNNGYTGIKAQGHFAFYNGEVVAFHGAIPVLMEYNSKTELAAQYGDAMTLPSHTGNGLFTKLGHLTDAVLQQNKVKFVWGFPNQNSEYGYINKLDWEGSKRMRCYIIKLKLISKEAIYRKSCVFKKKYAKVIESKISTLISNGVLTQHEESVNTVRVCRNNAYYEYKSATSNYTINLNDTMVWVKAKGGLLIGDIEIRSKNQFDSTLKDLKALALSLGLNKIIFQTHPGSKLNQVLSRSYESIDSWLIGYKNFDSDFPLEKLYLTYGDLDTF